MKIDITDTARAKVEEFLSAEGVDGRRLRFAIARTRCMGGRGHAYSLQVAKERYADDVALSSNGLSIFVDPASARLLGDVEVSYAEGFPESGFQVANSRSVGKCPCGHHDLFD